MTSFFSYTFSTLTFISEFENTQNSFSCLRGTPLVYLVGKIPQIFGQKLPIQEAHHILY